jgi:hypothetical protein
LVNEAVAWLLAIPLALVLTAWPAYEFGYISRSDLVNIFIGTGTGRYVRLAVVTLAWALVMAIIATVVTNRLRRPQKVVARAGTSVANHDA